MKNKKRLLTYFVLVVGLCMSVLLGGEQKNAQAITKAQVNKKITTLKKQVKSLEKKVAAAKKKEKKEGKGTVSVWGTIISRNPFILYENLFGVETYYWVENSNNLTNLITQSLGTVKLTGKYRNYNGITCAVCKAVKVSNKSAKYQKELNKKKKQLRDYQNSLKEQLILKETEVELGKTAKVRRSWKYSGKYNTIKWKSSNSKVAKIDSHGKIKGLKQGKAVITAVCSLSKKKSKCTVYVRDYFHVYNASTGKEIYHDDEIETSKNTLQLKCKFSNKNTKDSFEYKCKNYDGKATISKTGLITFSKCGSVRITVSSSYVYTSFNLTYEPEDEGTNDDEEIDDDNYDYDDEYNEDEDFSDDDNEEITAEKPSFQLDLNESEEYEGILNDDEIFQYDINDFGNYEITTIAEKDFYIRDKASLFEFCIDREKAKGDFEVNPKSVIIDGTEYKCLTYQDYENEYNDEYYDDEYEDYEEDEYDEQNHIEKVNVAVKCDNEDEDSDSVYVKKGTKITIQFEVAPAFG